jgi:putative tricarboxylic transport membrane protein
MVFQSFRIQGEPLERWHLRAPVFVLLGIALFGLTLERFGLLVAGPLTVFAAGFGLERVRFRELLIFALFISVVCAGLFRYLLKQPIPLLSIDTLGIFL